MEFIKEQRSDEDLKGPSNGMIQTVLLLVAMEAEAADFISAYDLREVTEKPALLQILPSRVYIAQVKGLKVVLVTNGRCSRFDCNNVGTTPAAVSAFAAIQSFQPDLVVNAGTAGGFHRVGGAVGDVYLCNFFAHHDRRIPLTEEEQRLKVHGVGAEHEVVPAEGAGQRRAGYHDYGYGLHQQLPLKALLSLLGCKLGFCSTSNSLDHTETDDSFLAANSAHVKDMEAAAIAWVVENSRPTPFFAVKVVTDLVDGEHPTEDEFSANLSTACAALSDALVRIFRFVAEGKMIQEL